MRSALPPIAASLVAAAVVLGSILGLAPRASATPPQLGISNEINHAIDRGIQRILAWQNEDGSFGGASHSGGYPMGQSALATYTLLKSGLRRDDPAIERAFRYLKQRPLAKVYSVSLWVLAMDAARDPALDEEIRRCAGWLESCFNEREDLWGYPEGHPELSNTQFAVLALWTAARHGYQADPRLWADMIGGTIEMQNDDGGFGYRPDDRPESHGSMTTAGITTLAVAIDALKDDPRYSKASRLGADSLERAWAWMDRHFTPTGNPTSDNGLLLDRHKVSSSRLYMFHYYYLWGLERIAAIAGRDEVGGRDWYREGAIQLLREEEDAGGWQYVDTTSFALLFLRRATYSGFAGREQEASIPRAIAWRYTTEEPPEGWEQPDFDDSGWKTGAAGFGSFQSAMRQDRTPWSTPDIWMRREFRWDRPASELQLFAQHDDGVWIYLNGVRAVANPVFSPEPKEYEVPAAARDTITPDRNVIAVHCRDDGGARTIDVAFHDRGGMSARLGKALEGEPKPWMQRRPEPGVPYLRRWLVLGPLADKKHAEFDEEPLDESEERPLAGRKSRGMSWREAIAPGALLDFVQALKPAEESFYYAFTYLIAEEDSDAVLWLGADDGMRVWFDGELVLSHHAHGAAVRDEIPIPLRLTAGAHALLVRVENSTGPTGLYARVCDLDARTPRGVVPALSPDEPDRAAIARAQPDFFELAELGTLLPLDRRTRIDFDKDSDVAALACVEAADGTPVWDNGTVTRKKSAVGGLAFNPGAKGLALVVAASNARPARLYWRTVVPEGGARFAATYAPAALPEVVPADKRPTETATPEPSPVVGGVRLALWGYRGGERIALGEDRAVASSEPDKNAWRRFEADLARVAGGDVLLILEVHADGVGVGEGAAFLDALELAW